MHYSICDYLLDVFQNSVEAGADTIEVDVREESDPGYLYLSVRDDGRGMDSRESLSALDPFYTDGKKHPGRKVGLGLPFLKQVLDETGGKFSLESKPGEGTVIDCRFPTSHIDCPPLGDIAGTAAMILSFPGPHELVIHRTRDELEYRITRSEILDALGDLTDVGALKLLHQFMESQEEFHGEDDA